MEQTKQLFKIGDRVRIVHGEHSGVIVGVITSSTIAYEIYFNDFKQAFCLNQALLEKVDENGNTTK